MVKEIALRKESGEVETFGVDWSNPHEMAADSAKSSGPGRNRVDPRIINMTDSKGQIISRGLLVSSNSPKKRTNEFVFTTTTNSFLPFLGRI